MKKKSSTLKSKIETSKGFAREKKTKKLKHKIAASLAKYAILITGMLRVLYRLIRHPD